MIIYSDLYEEHIVIHQKPNSMYSVITRFPTEEEAKLFQNQLQKSTEKPEPRRWWDD